MTHTNSSATCIEYVCNHYKLRPTNTPVDNNINSIVATLTCMSFYACEIRTDAVGLIDCPMPTIIETVKGFMVVIKTNAVGVTVMDPEDGNIHRIAFHDLVRIWTGGVVVIEPPVMKSKSFFERLFGP